MQSLNEAKKELIQDVDSLFPTIITVSLFFLTVIDILFHYANTSASQLGTVELEWANMPVAFIISYILFRIFKKKYKKWVLTITNILLLVELGLIAIAVTFVIINGDAIHSYLTLYSFKATLFCTGTVPTITLILLGLGPIFFTENSLMKLIFNRPR